MNIKYNSAQHFVIGEYDCCRERIIEKTLSRQEILDRDFSYWAHCERKKGNTERINEENFFIDWISKAYIIRSVE